jgi:hypothetical protein
MHDMDRAKLEDMAVRMREMNTKAKIDQIQREIERKLDKQARRIDKLETARQMEKLETTRKIEKLESARQMEKLEAARQMEQFAAKAKQDKKELKREMVMNRQLDTIKADQEKMKADQEKKDLQRQIKELTEGRQSYHHQYPAIYGESLVPSSLSHVYKSVPARSETERDAHHWKEDTQRKQHAEHQTQMRKEMVRTAEIAEIAQQEVEMQRELVAIEQDGAEQFAKAHRRKAAVAKKQHKRRAAQAGTEEAKEEQDWREMEAKKRARRKVEEEEEEEEEDRREMEAKKKARQEAEEEEEDRREMEAKKKARRKAEEEEEEEDRREMEAKKKARRAAKEEEEEDRREMEAKKKARRKAEEEEEDRHEMEAKKKARREAEEEQDRREMETKEQQAKKETKEQHVKNEPEATKVLLSQTNGQAPTTTKAPSVPHSAGTGSKPKARRTSRSTVPLPDKMDNHFFISHCQSTGGDQANAIYLELERLGFACWYEKASRLHCHIEYPESTNLLALYLDSKV